MNAFLQPRRRSDVHEHLGDRTCVGRGAIAVLRFGDVFGYENRVFADSAKTVSEFFGSVKVHMVFT